MSNRRLVSVTLAVLAICVLIATWFYSAFKSVSAYFEKISERNQLPQSSAPAIAKPGQSKAGLLAVEFGKSASGKASVKFKGDWQFPCEVVAISTKRLRIDNGFGSSSSFFGHTATQEFDCAPEDIAEVHFRMCGVQRFVIDNLAANPGIHTSPTLSVELIRPTLNGAGPIWTGTLPKYEEDSDSDDAGNRQLAVPTSPVK